MPHWDSVSSEKTLISAAHAEGKEEGLQEGMEKGMIKGKIETAKNLKLIGLTLEQISKATELSLDELKTYLK